MSAVPDVLACVGLFLAPGLMVTYLGGLRGITAWATAPLMTVAVAAAVALAGGLFGFRFGLWPVAAGTVVAAGLAAGLSLLLRARGIDRPPRDPRSYSLAVVIGAVVAAVIGAATFVTGVRRPDAISQTYDAVFHYSAIRYIEQTGKASPLAIGTLGQPGGGSFYPDAWHAMAALVAELTGAPVPVAAMITCLVIAVLVWPLGCLLLARHLFGALGGRAATAVVITGMVSSLFGAFPWMLMAWGVLWPNVLGLALAPAGVALGLSITRVSDGDTFGAVRRWLFGAAGAFAIGIAHPNAVLSVSLICLIPVLMVVGPYARDQWRRHALGTTLVLLAVVLVAAVGGFVASGLSTVRAVEAKSFPLAETPAHAVVSAFSNATNGLPAETALAAFGLIGVVACFVWRQRRWLVGAELLIVALYVGSAAIGNQAARLFTGPWYNDSHRIAATLPVVAIPLTTTGVLAAGEWLHRVAFRIGARPAFALVVPLAVGTAVAAATAAEDIPAIASTDAWGLSTSGNQMLTSPQKLQFLQTVARLVPASALVADNPFDGTAYLFAQSGTRVLFPQADLTVRNNDLTYLAHNLVQAGQNPRACDLIRQYGVGYLVIAPDDYLNKRQLPGPYYGVVYPPEDSGFRLIAADGSLRLYKITICQRPIPAAPIDAAGRSGG
jgi:hypothetical protein